MPNMNTTILSELPLVMPGTKEEQEEIAGFLNSVDAKRSALTTKQTHYQSLKRGLMQKLLTVADLDG
jgi:type I restriction enzyme S subunit